MRCCSEGKGKGGSGKNVKSFLLLGLILLVVLSTGSGATNLNPTSLSSINTSLAVGYPDLTVAGFNSPTREDKNASVNIENTGIENATNVTVRFEVSEHGETEITGNKTGWQHLTKEGAANIRIHFAWLDARDEGWLEIKKNLTDEVPEKRYSGELFLDEWSPWVEGDTIWLVYSLSGDGSFVIDAYEWGDAEDKIIGNISANESVNVSLPSQWNKYEKYDEPRRLTVTVDPDNNITELKEGNNVRTGLMYIDLVPEGIRFVAPQEDYLSVDVRYFTIRATIKNINEREGIIFPASDFNVSLEVRWDSNDTVAFRQTKSSNEFHEFLYTNKRLYAGEEVNVTFVGEYIFPDSEDYEYYTVAVIADSEGDIIEASDFYQLGEGNNETSVDNVLVYPFSGYAGGDLYDVTPLDNRIYGDVVYSIGNSVYWGLGYTSPYEVHFTDVNIPVGAEIKNAWLYLYWVWSSDSSPDVDMLFNDVPVSCDRSYDDETIATTYDCWYGTYVYDVTAIVNDTVSQGGSYYDYEAIAEKHDYAGLSGMLLLIVYEDEREPLIKYWINEGAEVMRAENGATSTGSTGLPFDRCIANASFEGVTNLTRVSDARLLTVLPSWTTYPAASLFSPPEGDELMFNGWDVNCPLTKARDGTSHWAYEGGASTGALGDDCMAFTGNPGENHWVDVTDYLNPRDNLAQIQSKGNYMMVANAVLKLTYLPDQTFDIGYSENPYPSISGVHKGTIVLNHSINVSKMYTYPCPGTGGHTEYVEISNESGIMATGQWNGYKEDWHNISFYPSFKMLANHTYNYTIHTGSYPQIIHEQNHTTSNGYINSTSFIDANGFVHNDWLPAIRLWKG